MVFCQIRQKVITIFVSALIYTVIRIPQSFNVIEHSYQKMWIDFLNHHQMLVQSLMMCLVTFQLIFIYVHNAVWTMTTKLVASIKVLQHHVCICNASYLTQRMNEYFLLVHWFHDIVSKVFLFAYLKGDFIFL